LVPARRERQRLKRLHLDDAAHPLLGFRLGLQPREQRDCLIRLLLGEQQPR
jgi:hypothetical protein